MTSDSLVANALCLELVNTVNNWFEPSRDALADPAAAVSWAGQVGIRLGTEPYGPALERARLLRARIHQSFQAVAHHESPRPSDLADVTAAYAMALGSARLEPSTATYDLTWPDPGTLDDLLARVAASAVDLLVRGPLDRVGECPSCGWLFVDTSRNGRRRWCSMQTCGARVKARRHYANRAASPEA